LVQSKLFNGPIFNQVIESPLVEGGDHEFFDRNSSSRLKLVFIQNLTTICNNEPAQIKKMIDDGKLSHVVSQLKEALPVNQNVMFVLFEFLRIISISEDGR